MIRKTLVAAACCLLIGVGFAAGYAVGTNSAQKAAPPIEPTSTDRWAQWMLDEAQRTKPQVDKQLEDAERLQKAFMNKLDRDLRKIE